MRDKLKTFAENENIETPEVIEPMVCKPEEVEPWRVFRIMSEFVEGFETLQKYGLAATFFGSARADFNDQVYRDTEALAGKLAKKGFTIISGGSYGVMQAANKGAKEVGGNSVGLNIKLPQEQEPNPYLTDEAEFDHFFVRKVMLSLASEVYIYMPGGFGTLDEFFEILTLVQTKKIKPIPIVLLGKAYWEPILDLIRTELYGKYRAIDKEDMQLYYLADSVEDAYEYIVNNVKC